MQPGKSTRKSLRKGNGSWKVTPKTKTMKTNTRYLYVLALAAFVFTACSQKNEQTLESMLADKEQQQKVMEAIAQDHELSMKMIGRMMENDHATGMLADGLVEAAAKDTVLAASISKKMALRPELMMLTVHHFMPVINGSEQACEHFSAETMQQPNIAQNVCKRMEENPELSCH